MTLDEMEKTFCNRGWMGQEEAVLAVQLVPKLLKVAGTAKNFLAYREQGSEFILSELLAQALAELEQT